MVSTNRTNSHAQTAPTSSLELVAHLSQARSAGAERICTIDIKAEGLVCLKIGEQLLAYSKLGTERSEPLTEIPQYSVVKSITQDNSGCLTLEYIRPNYESALIQNQIVAAAPADLEIVCRGLTTAWKNPHLKQGNWDNWDVGSNSAESSLATLESSNAVAQAILEFNLSPKNILFLGCGRCLEIHHFLNVFRDTFAGANLTGIDSSTKQLELAKKLGTAQAVNNFGMTLELIAGNLFELSPSITKGQKFDLVISQGIFDRATLTQEQGETVFAGLTSLLKPGATCISTAYGPNLFELADWRRLGAKPIAGCLAQNLLKPSGTKADLYVLRVT